MRPTPPFDRVYPNRDKVVDDVMPTICTFLFGFTGAFFGTAASADRGALGKLAQLSLPFTTYATPEMERKGLVLLVTGLCCAGFFISLLTALFSKFTDPEPGWAKISAEGNRSDVQKRIDKAAYDALVARQQWYRLVSAVSYNIAIALLPLSGILFLKNAFVGWVLLLYLGYLAWALGRWVSSLGWR
jgi:hypothetical protein